MCISNFLIKWDVTRNNKLKDKFKSTIDKSLKIEIITTQPQSWTLKQIENEFGVSNFISQKPENLSGKMA